MKCLMPVLSSLILGLYVGPVAAASYQWTDAEGTAHFTDNPQDLPEPLRTKVLKELFEQQKRKQNQPQHPRPTHQSDPLPDTSTERLPENPQDVPPVNAVESDDTPARATPANDAAAQKKLWRDKFEQARKNVDDLTKRCEDLRLELAQATNAVAITSLPSDRVRAMQADADLKRCEQDREKARRYVKDGLPEEARRAGIPPGWVR